jgi:hypothetical protein
VTFQHRQQLIACDDLLGDEDVPQRSVAIGSALNAERFLQLGRGQQAFGN